MNGRIYYAQVHSLYTKPAPIDLHTETGLYALSGTIKSQMPAIGNCNPLGFSPAIQVALTEYLGPRKE